MRAQVLSLLVALALSCSLLQAQAPTPDIVPPASANAISPQVDYATLQAAVKVLQEMKATNAELLEKQAATLEQLDELEKTVQQIKIFTKRG